LGLALLSAGTLVAAAAVALRTSAAIDSAGRSWPPFVLVAGLLLIGAVANEDGLFASIAGLIGRLPGGSLPLYAASMLLVAAVTVVLNLDTSVAFLTPVLLQVARLRTASEERYLYGCVFTSNAASLLLPGSNLTNLLVLAEEHVSGSVFLSRMAAPWLASVLVTIVVAGLAFRGSSAGPTKPQPLQGSPRLLSIVAVAGAVALILALADSALPVLGVGLAIGAVRLVQRRIELRRLGEAVDVLSLLGVFLIALALGTLARAWSFPGQLMAGADDVATAVIGALASVLVNNLPAAVLLSSPTLAHPRSLLLGLNIGPNLAVTGSLSALIWWRVATSAGAKPSARRYSAVGIVLVPLTLAAALAAERLRI
jgi:arsenical pump membrane protein